MSVSYTYYSETYGGGLTEAAFSACVGTAEAHVKWLCSVRGVCASSTCYKRAVCAACEAFAEFGQGEVGGYSIGSFTVRNYENKGTTGEEVATAAALRELGLSGMAFAGVR